MPARHLTYNKLFTLLDVEPGEQRVFLDAVQVLLSDPIGDPARPGDATAGVSALTLQKSFLGDWDQLYRHGLPPRSAAIAMGAPTALATNPSPLESRHIHTFVQVSSR